MRATCEKYERLARGIAVARATGPDRGTILAAHARLPSSSLLVVAISSRALFDFEEENRVFSPADDRPYRELQLKRIEQPAKPGIAYPLVRKLLAFNADRRVASRS